MRKNKQKVEKTRERIKKVKKEAIKNFNLNVDEQISIDNFFLFIRRLEKKSSLIINHEQQESKKASTKDSIKTAKPKR